MGIDEMVSDEKPKGFSANYSDAAPDKLLQLALLSQRPALLEFTGADGTKGRIRCEKGEAIDASIDGTRGATCVDDVLGIPGGKARVVFLPDTTLVLWRPSGSSEQAVARVPRPRRRWRLRTLQSLNVHWVVATLGLLSLLCAVVHRWPRGNDEPLVQAQAKVQELPQLVSPARALPEPASRERSVKPMPHWLSLEPLMDGGPQHPVSLIEIAGLHQVEEAEVEQADLVGDEVVAAEIVALESVSRTASRLPGGKRRSRGDVAEPHRNEKTPPADPGASALFASRPRVEVIGEAAPEQQRMASRAPGSRSASLRIEVIADRRPAVEVID